VAHFYLWHHRYPPAAKHTNMLPHLY
jgi:hypothetical protein